LEERGHDVELAGIFYHLGENDMSFGPHRKNAAKWLTSFVGQSRSDLELPNLKWYVSQQRPTDHEQVNAIDVVAAIEQAAARDSNLVHIRAFELPEQEKQLVIDTAGIVALGEVIAAAYFASSED
jgi:hypothetical protein